MFITFSCNSRTLKFLFTVLSVKVFNWLRKPFAVFGSQAGLLFVSVSQASCMRAIHGANWPRIQITLGQRFVANTSMLSKAFLVIRFLLKEITSRDFCLGWPFRDCRLDLVAPGGTAGDLSFPDTRGIKLRPAVKWRREADCNGIHPASLVGGPETCNIIR